MGVWIETYKAEILLYSVLVTPFVGVWIETLSDREGWRRPPVTPFVGVWIETLTVGDVASGRGVTPFVGVWIETVIRKKQPGRYFVTPFVGVWIETSRLITTEDMELSHPSWVCGLKRPDRLGWLTAQGSHPSWVCGLKLDLLGIVAKLCEVTPFVGVWIETWASVTRRRAKPGHTLRGCVD